MVWDPTEQALCILQALTQKTFFSCLLSFAVCVPLTVSQYSLQLLHLWEYAKPHTPPALDKLCFGKSIANNSCENISCCIQLTPGMLSPIFPCCSHGSPPFVCEWTAFQPGCRSALPGLALRHSLLSFPLPQRALGHRDGTAEDCVHRSHWRLHELGCLP